MRELEAPNRSWSSGGALRPVVKRALDVAGATVALALLAPVMAMIALAIVADSRGPVLFRAERVGFRGRPLRMLKFRKMHDAARGAPLTVAGDERLTRVGRWLVRTKLDELPQLWHVLRGEMSLVGPRPESPGFVARFPEDYAVILLARPGLTGYTQLAFAREGSILDGPDPHAHYVDVLLPQKVALDRLYVSSASIRRDLRILVATFVTLALRQPVAVHRGTGALTIRRRDAGSTRTRPRDPDGRSSTPPRSIGPHGDDEGWSTRASRATVETYCDRDSRLSLPGRAEAAWFGGLHCAGGCHGPLDAWRRAVCAVALVGLLSLAWAFALPGMARASHNGGPDSGAIAGSDATVSAGGPTSTEAAAPSTGTAPPAAGPPAGEAATAAAPAPPPAVVDAPQAPAPASADPVPATTDGAAAGSRGGVKANARPKASGRDPGSGDGGSGGSGGAAAPGPTGDRSEPAGAGASLGAAAAAKAPADAGPAATPGSSNGARATTPAPAGATAPTPPATAPAAPAVAATDVPADAATTVAVTPATTDLTVADGARRGPLPGMSSRPLGTDGVMATAHDDPGARPVPPAIVTEPARVPGAPGAAAHLAEPLALDAAAVGESVADALTPPSAALWRGGDSDAATGPRRDSRRPAATQRSGRGGPSPAPMQPDDRAVGTAAGSAASGGGNGTSAALWCAIVAGLLLCAAQQLRRHHFRLAVPVPGGFSTVLKQPG